MKVRNMTDRTGRGVSNQFIIETEETVKTTFADGEPNNTPWGAYEADVEYFQSYDSIIVRKEYGPNHNITLDVNYWDYSVTTGKYRNQFLGETKKETEAKIKSGEYKLVDLN